MIAVRGCRYWAKFVEMCRSWQDTLSCALISGRIPYCMHEFSMEFHTVCMNISQYMLTFAIYVCPEAS